MENRIHVVIIPCAICAKCFTIQVFTFLLETEMFVSFSKSASPLSLSAIRVSFVHLRRPVSRCRQNVRVCTICVSVCV